MLLSNRFMAFPLVNALHRHLPFLYRMLTLQNVLQNEMISYIVSNLNELTIKQLLITFHVLCTIFSNTMYIPGVRHFGILLSYNEMQNLHIIIKVLTERKTT